MSSPAAPASRQRSPGLDAARAFAVAAMVFGHTAEATLSEATRALPAMQVYWGFRGLTAPLFLFVAGWAVITVVDRNGLQGWDVLRARLPRILTLFGLGLLLRWPGWGLPQLFALDREVWRHFLGFDALHCIGASLLAGSLVLSFTNGFRARAAAMAALTIVLPLVSGAVAAAATTQHLPLPLYNALVAHQMSPFPVLPWAGYFFGGSAVGMLLTLIGRQWVRAVALAGTGAALTFGAWVMGLADLPNTSPVLFTSRLGQVLIICSLAMLLPVAFARRLAPLGKASLVVYVAHLPVVYGWSTFAGLNARLGRTLELWQVFAVAGTLLLFGLLLARFITTAKTKLRQLRAGRSVSAASST